MARDAEAAASGSGGVKAVAAVLAVVVLSILVLLLVRARPGPEPFDPRSGQPSGARGLVLTLDAAGAEVSDTRTVPPTSRTDDTCVLVLEDRLDPDQRSDLVDFVEAGGVAVVADPESSLHGGSGVDGGAVEIRGVSRPGAVRLDARREANVEPGRCDIAALADLRGVFASDGLLFPVGAEEPACFTDPAGLEVEEGRRSFVIVRELGDGLVIGLGDNEPFINRDLRFADNSALAVALLVPEVGTRVTIVVGSGATTSVQDVGSGDDTLVDLVPAWAWMAILLGGIAFVVFAASRSVRLGRVLTEPLPTPIAASELVSATGNLMQRAGHDSHAAWLLRERYHRDLCSAHGVPASASLSELDRVVSERAGTSLGEIEHVLRAEVGGRGGLVAIASAIHRSRLVTLPDDTRRSEPVGDPARPTAPERAGTP